MVNGSFAYGCQPVEWGLLKTCISHILQKQKRKAGGEGENRWGKWRGGEKKEKEWRRLERLYWEIKNRGVENRK